MTKHAMKWAIAKLREYAADDEIDREKLTPLLASFDSGDMPEFLAKCKVTLYDYCAANVFIDELYWYAMDYYKPPVTPQETADWLNKFSQL